MSYSVFDSVANTFAPVPCHLQDFWRDAGCVPYELFNARLLNLSVGAATCRPQDLPPVSCSKIISLDDTIVLRHHSLMIKTFANKQTAALFIGFSVRRFSGKWVHVARRKLAQINNALHVDDLLIPPGNRLEKLSGNREGQYSIRVNDQWRICFGFEAGDAYEVEVVDYH